MATDQHHLRLTLRTLLAYLDDTLPAADAKHIGVRLAENPEALELVDRIKRVIRKRSLTTPSPSTFEKKTANDPNVVAGYLSDTLLAEALLEYENICLESDTHLAEVAACHQILTMLLCEQMRVPPTAYQRMYALVDGPESVPHRKPNLSLPVGGVLLESPAQDHDDADAAYLLGMPTFSKSEPIWKRSARLSLAALLGIGFLLASWIVWPKSNPAQKEPEGYAALIPEKKTVVVSVPEPKAEPKIPLPEVPKPMEPLPIPMPKPVEPMPMPMPVEPMPPKPIELVPEQVPTKPGEVALGTLEQADQVVLVAKKSEDMAWKRVGSKDNPATTGSSLICLPGYKGKLKLDNGANVELWGNLPGLLPYPVLETNVIFHVPYDGYAADFTLTAGRVYLSTSQELGTQFRLRVHKEIWDITLPDAQAIVAVEVVNQLVPSRVAELPQSTIALHVVKGKAALKLRSKTIPTITANENVFWSNKGRGLVGPFKSAEEIGGDTAYFSRIPVYPSEASAKLTLDVLDEFAKRLTDPSRVRAMLAELVREQRDITFRVVTEGAIGVYGLAAVGNIESLVELLNDPTRFYFRQFSFMGLRQLMANQPKLEDEFRTEVKKKCELDGNEVDELFRYLKGASVEDRRQPEFLDMLLAGLSAKPLVLREAAFAVLMNDVDRPSQKVRRLSDFNAGDTPEARDPFVKAWTTRIAELKAQPAFPEKKEEK